MQCAVKTHWVSIRMGHRCVCVCLVSGYHLHVPIERWELCGGHSHYRSVAWTRHPSSTEFQKCRRRGGLQGNQPRAAVPRCQAVIGPRANLVLGGANQAQLAMIAGLQRQYVFMGHDLAQCVVSFDHMRHRPLMMLCVMSLQCHAHLVWGSTVRLGPVNTCRLFDFVVVFDCARFALIAARLIRGA